MGFEGLGDLMRSRCLSQETPKPVAFLLKPVCDAAHFVEDFVRAVNAQVGLIDARMAVNTCSTASFTSSIGIRSPRAIWF
jgi:hypothetical protein